jgi:hypothetical protein
VKWKMLGYGECTWETKEILKERVPNFKEKMQYYKKINSQEVRGISGVLAYIRNYKKLLNLCLRDLRESIWMK